VALKEISPGKYLRLIHRPAVGPLPFRALFHRVDMAEAKSHRVSRHRHDHYEVLLPQRGEYRCRINDEEWTIAPGGAAVLTPGDWHEDLCDGPIAFMSVWLRVQPGRTPEHSLSILRDDVPARARVLRDASALHVIAERMVAEHQSSDAFVGALLDALALEFICRLGRLLPSEALRPQLLLAAAQHGFAASLMRVFEKHVSHNLSLAAIATAMCMSERTLNAHCAAAFKSPAMRLFTRFRMDHARILLQQTDLTVAEVSEHLGFANPYHFSAVYKRMHDKAPALDR
jgi:AraC family transcriptional regulator, transcriptional activator of pobA